jgi:prepilin-type N-terminal cleavage/methylation domain-containing protein
VITRGFSLIELSIVLFIAAILLTAGLRALNSQVENSNYNATRKQQELIKDALITYLGRNSRLPCPDTAAFPDGTEKRMPLGTPTISVCVNFFGVVPYATLGLSKDAALDGWENHISYRVSPEWTTAGAPQTSVAANAFSVDDTGILTVNDRVPAVNAIPTPLTIAAVVVLISSGKNGLGAITSRGSQNVAPAPGTDEFVNVSGLGALGVLGATYYKREYTDTAVPIYGDFDDVVRVIQAGELIAPLVRDGSLKTTPSALQSVNQTISAMNDAIIGAAIALHGAPPSGNYFLPPASGVGSIAPPNDPWGKPLRYAPTSTLVVGQTGVAQFGGPAIAYTISSDGPNGTQDVVDDIVFTMPLTGLQQIFNRIAPGPY